jgi:hypothetical protein
MFEHDASHQSLFSHRAMVIDLIRDPRHRPRGLGTGIGLRLAGALPGER